MFETTKDYYINTIEIPPPRKEYSPLFFKYKFDHFTQLWNVEYKLERQLKWNKLRELKEEKQQRLEAQKADQEYQEQQLKKQKVVDDILKGRNDMLQSLNLQIVTIDNKDTIEPLKKDKITKIKNRSKIGKSNI